MPVPTPQAFAGAKAAQMAAGRRRRNVFLKAMEETGNIHEACGKAGVALGTYHKWRVRFDDFAAQVDALRASVAKIDQQRVKIVGNFAERAFDYFDHTFAWFHILAATMMADARGGDVNMLLWPPEHGKTTLTEDFCNDMLAIDPSYRITYGTADLETAKKILKRVKARMEPDGPTPKYVRRYGPFAPVAGKGRVAKQPWAAGHFDIFKKGSFDDRDYSMQALGMGGTVLNTRCDLLALDDVQSSKDANVSHSERLLNVIRGDWLTRPGTTGHTHVNGSRQGPDDVLGSIVKAEIVDRLIKLPAFDESRVEQFGTPWLWLEPGTFAEKEENIKAGRRHKGPPYTEEEYDKLRRNAGEERWDLTYLQKDGSRANMTFREEHWGPCCNTMRSVIHDPPVNRDPETQIQRIVVGLDPAIGSHNGVFVAGLSYKRIYVLGCMSVPGLTNNDQVFGLVEEYCHQYRELDSGLQVTDVIIESKAYQKSLMDDQKLHDLEEYFGFNSWPHDTGINKYDENLGVPQMVYSLKRREFDFPFAGTGSRGEMEGLFAELGTWRPHIAGKRLRMDRVMAMWFVWMFWRNLRPELKPHDDIINQFKTRGMGYAPTNYKPLTSGLLVPARG